MLLALSFSLLLVTFVSTRSVVIDSPIISLPLSKRVNLTGAESLKSRDLKRISALRGRNGVVQSVPIYNGGLHSHYTVPIGVGSPPTTYHLMVDTGSSNTWVGGVQAYVKTSTSIDTGVSVEVPYFYWEGPDEMFVRPLSPSTCYLRSYDLRQGEEFLDQVTLAPGLIITNQSIGVGRADAESNNLVGVDGVLGVGPVFLSEDTLETDNSVVPTVTDNAFSQGLIAANQIGISLEPADESGVFNGEITWGGTDSSKFVGEINFAPTAGDPHLNPSLVWTFEQTVSYGDQEIMGLQSAIADTGSSLIWLPPSTFTEYASLTNATLDENTQDGLLHITLEQFNNLQSLFFNINGVSYELTPNAQVWPRELNSAIGGEPDVLYLVVVSTVAGGCINGQAFLERFYSVWDTTTQQVGFAYTPWTYA